MHPSPRLEKLYGEICGLDTNGRGPEDCGECFAGPDNIVVCGEVLAGPV